MRNKKILDQTIDKSDFEKIVDKINQDNTKTDKIKYLLKLLKYQPLVKGVNYSGSSSFKVNPKNIEASSKAFKEGNIGALLKNSEIIELHRDDLPNIVFKGNSTVKTIEVAISSTQAEDENLLNNLYRKTLNQL